MHHDPIKIIQISDTHLFADPKQSLLGVNTQDSFQAITNLLQTKKNTFDFMIHSGDISQDGSSDSYERFAEMLQGFEVPIYYTAGNHDDERMMLNVYPYKNVFNDKHIILKNWHIILLNSQKKGEVPGYLDQTQLHQLEHALKATPDLFAMIMFHHHPFLIGSEWLDPLGIQNAEAFWKIIRNYPKVKVVFFGHVHQENAQQFNGIPSYSAPSTCFQFKKQNSFGLDNLPPGYRWIHLFDDGHVQTGIDRVSQYVGVFEEHAKGY